MSRGDSFGGGRSSLGYLFESYDDEIDRRSNKKPEKQPPAASSDSHNQDKPKQKQEEAADQKIPAAKISDDHSKQEKGPSQQATDQKKPAAQKDREQQVKRNSVISNNYHRAHGQNSGNFITGRPSTKVQAAPGGESSLGYLFGENSSDK